MSFSLPDKHLHGTDGPVVVVPARVAALLVNRAGLGEFYLAHRGRDSEADAVLAALASAARGWRTTSASAGSDSGTSLVDHAEPESPSAREVSTTEAARRLSVSDSAVRKAIRAGRIPARRVGGRWVLDPEDVEHLAAVRAAA